MKKFILSIDITTVLLAIVIIVLSVIGFIGLVNNNNLGGRSASESFLDYSFSSTTHTATSTSDSANILLLAEDASRQYALIENDSDTVVYVGLTSASSTITVNTGIRINANGGTYEIDQDNLYTGEVWMATTTASKNILITYY